jgi:hypothetical protein
MAWSDAARAAAAEARRLRAKGRRGQRSVQAQASAARRNLGELQSMALGGRYPAGQANRNVERYSRVLKRLKAKAAAARAAKFEAKYGPKDVHRRRYGY